MHGDGGVSRERERFSPVDAAWLRMDSPTNAMVITALLAFDDAPSFDEVTRFVRERLLAHRRFRQFVHESPLGPPTWVLAEDVDLGRHLLRSRLSAPGGDAELRRAVSVIASTPLARDLPLWRIHYLEGYGAGAALVVRLHHCLGDGVALVRLLFGLTDDAELEDPAAVGVSAPEPHGLVERGRVLEQQLTTLGRLLILPNDTRTSLSGALGKDKRVAWSRAVPLADAKSIAHAVGAKLNDVLVSALAGALRNHLEARGGYQEGLEIRAMVPVYVRQEEAGHRFGNHFGLVYLSLPLGETDPIARLREVGRRFAQIKSQPDAVVALGVLAAMGIATAQLEHIGIELFTKKATVMITNVPGPPSMIHLIGKPLRDMMLWAPVSGHIGAGMSLITYDGRVRLGIAADVLRMPEPEQVAEDFVAELERAKRALDLTPIGANIAGADP
jgi:diacylglycerol O-acyltransferase / wax synthase